MDINKYIGIPFKANGRDSTGLDCWGLVRLVYKQEYNIDLPSFTTEYDINDDERIKELFDQYKEGWIKLDFPEPGCAVIFNILGETTHIGIFVENNKFLHVREGMDSVLESLENQKWNRRVQGFYKYNENTGVVLNGIPHPLRTVRFTAVIQPNTTISDLVQQLKSEHDISEDFDAKYRILVNGVPIDSSVWNEYTLKEGDRVEYRAILGKNNKVVRIVALLAVAYVSMGVAAFVTEVAAGGALVAGASVGLAKFIGAAAGAVAYAATNSLGMKLIDAIAPIVPKEQADPGMSERQLLVDGGSNQANKYGSIPVVLGKVKLTPPLGAEPVSQFSGDESTAGAETGTENFLKMLLIWGYGPLSIDYNTLKVGDVLLSEYDGVTQVHLDRINEPTTAQLAAFDAIYGSDTQQLPGNSLPGPKQTVNNVVTDTAPPLSVGDTDWVPSTGVGEWREFAFTQPSERIAVVLHFSQGLRRIRVSGSEAGATDAAPVRIGFQYRIGTGSWQPWTTKTIGGTLTTNNYIASGAPKKDAFSWSITLNRGNRWGPNDLISIRARRETGALTDPSAVWRYSHDCAVHSLTSYRNTKPTIDPINSKIAKSALSIKATEQVNGRIEGINAVVQTYCKDYYQGTWTDDRATNNPASLFRHVLTHPGTPNRILDADIAAKIDLTKLQHWHSYCVTKGFTYNSVIAGNNSVLDVLREICAAGRASPIIVDGKWSVVIDEVQNNIVQHFTPHNSWDFEGSKAVVKYPDCLRIRFFDEDNNYQEDEVLVYKAGKNSTNSELFEEMQFPGVTKRSAVIDHARWHMAQGVLRPERYTIQTDLEYLVCNRGDRVKVTHDVPLWGLGSGRIKTYFSENWSAISNGILAAATNQEPHNSIFKEVFNNRFLGDINNSGGVSSADSIAAIQYSNGSTTNATYINGIFRHVLGNNVSKYASYLTFNATATQIQLEEAVYLDVTKSYTIRIRKQDGSSVTSTIVNPTTSGYYNSVILSTPLTGLNELDLYMFGELNKESQDLIVLGIQPESSGNATITLMDYGVTSTYNIFTEYLNYTELPSFNTNITKTSRNLIDSFGTKVPTNIVFTSNETVMERKGPADFVYRLLVSFINANNLPKTKNFVECQLDFAASTDESSVVTKIVKAETYSVLFEDVLVNKAYRVRLRYVGEDGRTGPWTVWYTHTILGKSGRPTDVTGFISTVSETGIVLTWNAATDSDYSYSIIKLGSSWSTATTLFRGSANSWSFNRPATGNYTFLIKHIDTSGNESLVATSRGVSYTSAAVNNAGITINNGAIQGIGTGSGTTVANTSIGIVGGAITGIGTGNNTTVANSSITVDSNGSLQGIGTGAGTTVDNSRIQTIELTTYNGGRVINGNSFEPGPTTPVGQSASFISKQAFANGCFVTYKPTFVSTVNESSIVVAISQSQIGFNVSPNDIFVALAVYNDGRLYAYTNTAPNSLQSIQLNSAYVSGDFFSITYDGSRVIFYKNGTVIYELSYTNTNPLYIYGNSGATGSVTVNSISRLSFGPMSSNAWSQITGQPAGIYNSNITITDGAITGIGTGNNTTVANSSIAISNGAITGIGTGNNTAVANSSISINADGTLSGAGSGQVNLSDLPGSINLAQFASGIEPVSIVSTLPTTKTTSNVFLTTNNKLYRWNGTDYVSTLLAGDIEGTLSAAQIESVAAGQITGKLTDNQLDAISAAKLTGQITGTQITDEAISAAKIAANTITASQIAANTITAAEIAANAITATELAAGAVTAGKIAAGTIEAGDIAAGAITAGKIAANAITATELAADSVTAGKIAAAAVNTTALAAEAVTAGKIAADTLSSDNVLTRGLTVRDSNGNIILSAGSNLDWTRLANQPSGIYNSNITVDTNGAIQGIGTGAGTQVNNAFVENLVLLAGTRVSVYGNSVKRTDAGTAAWNAHAYSKDGYIAGVYCSFKPDQTNSALMVGLNSDPELNESYDSLDYAWYFENTNLKIYESGSQVANLNETYTTSDVFAVTYDGSYVRYLKNGEVKRTVSVNTNPRLYFDCSIFSLNAGVSKINFGPMTSNRWENIGGGETALNTRLAKAGDTITGRINLGVADGVFAGTDLNNGVYFGNGGLVGKKAGNTTFAISTTGDAIFAGTIAANTIETNSLKVGAGTNSTLLNSSFSGRSYNFFPNTGMTTYTVYTDFVNSNKIESRSQVSVNINYYFQIGAATTNANFCYLIIEPEWYFQTIEISTLNSYSSPTYGSNSVLAIPKGERFMSSWTYTNPVGQIRNFYESNSFNFVLSPALISGTTLVTGQNNEQYYTWPIPEGHFGRVWIRLKRVIRFYPTAATLTPVAGDTSSVSAGDYLGNIVYNIRNTRI